MLDLIIRCSNKTFVPQAILLRKDLQHSAFIVNSILVSVQDFKFIIKLGHPYLLCMNKNFLYLADSSGNWLDMYAVNFKSNSMQQILLTFYGSAVKNS